MPNKIKGTDAHMIALRRWGEKYLSAQQNAVWQKLIRNDECRIVDLYKIARPDDDRGFTLRQKHQSVGFVVSRINIRLTGVNSKYRVKPGEARFTYKLFKPYACPIAD